VVLSQALGRHSVRERQSNADRHGRRLVVSALSTLDDPRSVRAMDNSWVVRAAHADLLLLLQRPLAERHPICAQPVTTKALDSGHRALGPMAARRQPEPARAPPPPLHNDDTCLVSFRGENS